MECTLTGPAKIFSLLLTILLITACNNPEEEQVTQSEKQSPQYSVNPIDLSVIKQQSETSASDTTQRTPAEDENAYLNLYFGSKPKLSRRSKKGQGKAKKEEKENGETPPESNSKPDQDQTTSANNETKVSGKDKKSVANVKNIFITVDRVYICLVDSECELLKEESQQFDLLTLDNARDLLVSNKKLKPGTYEQIRLHVTDAHVVLDDETTAPLIIPSATNAKSDMAAIKFVGTYTLEKGLIVSYTIRIDTAIHFHKTSGANPKYMLRSVIHVEGGDVKEDLIPPLLNVDPLPLYFNPEGKILRYTYSDPDFDNLDVSSFDVLLNNTNDITSEFTITDQEASTDLSGYSDGYYHFKTSISDYAPNTTTLEKGYYIDSTPPNIEIQEPVINGPFVEFNINYTDNISLNHSDVKIWVNEEDYTNYFDIGLFGATATISFQNLNLGRNTISAAIQDKAGNETISDDVEFYTDVTPPEITIIKPAQNDLVGTDVKFFIKYQDDLSGCNDSTLSVVVNGTDYVSHFTKNNAEAIAIIPGSLLYEGNNNLTVQISDFAGNVRTTSPVFFTVDTTPPTLSISMSPEGYSNDTFSNIIRTENDHVITLNFSDLHLVLGSMHYYFQTEDGEMINKAGDLEYPSSLVATHLLKNLADGKYKVVFSFDDEAGNHSEVTTNFIVDNTEPSVIAVKPTNNLYPNDVPFEFSFFDEIAKVNPDSISIKINNIEMKHKFQISLDGAIASISDEIFPDGENNVEIKISDAVGNSYEGHIAKFHIDNMPPQFTFNQPKQGDVIDASSLNINIDYHNGISGVNMNSVVILLNNVDITSELAKTDASNPGQKGYATGLIDISRLLPGLNTLSIRAIDNAGVISPVSKIEFSVPNAQAPVAETELDDLQQESPTESVEISWNAATSSPSLVTGEFQAEGENVNVKALNFVEDHKKIYQINTNEIPFTEQINVSNQKTDSRGGAHVELQQVYQGIEVFGAKTTVHIQSGDKITATNGEYKPNLSVNTMPTISNLDAESKLIDLHQEEKTLNVQSKLVIVNSKIGFREYGFDHLAWKVSLHTNEGSYEAFIDAHSGEILINTKTGMGAAIYGRDSSGKMYQSLNPSNCDKEENIKTAYKKVYKFYCDNFSHTGMSGNEDSSICASLSFEDMGGNLLYNDDLYLSSSGSFSVYRKSSFRQIFNNESNVLEIKHIQDAISLHSSLCNWRSDEEITELIAHEFVHGIIANSVPEIIQEGEAAVINEGISLVMGVLSTHIILNGEAGVMPLVPILKDLGVYNTKYKTLAEIDLTISDYPHKNASIISRIAAEMLSAYADSSRNITVQNTLKVVKIFFETTLFGGISSDLNFDKFRDALLVTGNNLDRNDPSFTKADYHLLYLAMRLAKIIKTGFVATKNKSVGCIYKESISNTTPIYTYDSDSRLKFPQFITAPSVSPGNAPSGWSQRNLGYVAITDDSTKKPLYRTTRKNDVANYSYSGYEPYYNTATGLQDYRRINEQRSHTKKYYDTWLGTDNNWPYGVENSWKNLGYIYNSPVPGTVVMKKYNYGAPYYDHYYYALGSSPSAPSGNTFEADIGYIYSNNDHLDYSNILYRYYQPRSGSCNSYCVDRSPCQKISLQSNCKTWSPYYYKIISNFTDNAAEVYGYSYQDGARLAEWDWLGDDNQKWELRDAGSGYIQLVAKHSKKCVDIQDPSAWFQIFQPLVQKNCQSVQHQQFSMNILGWGIYSIINRFSGLAMSLEIFSTYGQNGSIIYQSAFSPGAFMDWRVNAVERNCLEYQYWNVCTDHGGDCLLSDYYDGCKGQDNGYSHIPNDSLYSSYIYRNRTEGYLVNSTPHFNFKHLIAYQKENNGQIVDMAYAKNDDATRKSELESKGYISIHTAGRVDVACKDSGLNALYEFYNPDLKVHYYTFDENGYPETFMPDNIPPEIAIEVAGTYQNIQSVPLEISYSDFGSSEIDISKLEIDVNGHSIDTSNASHDGIIALIDDGNLNATGENIITITICDNDDNCKTEVQSLYFDNSPPDISIEKPISDSIHGKIVPIKINYEDSGSNVKTETLSVIINGIEFKEYFSIGPEFAEGFIPGDKLIGWPNKNEIIVSIANNAGGVTTSNSLQFEVDIEPPKIVIEQPHGLLGDIDFKATYSDNRELNISSIKIFINETEHTNDFIITNNEATARLASSTVSAGKNLIRVIAEDSLGNESIEEYIFLGSEAVTYLESVFHNAETVDDIFYYLYYKFQDDPWKYIEFVYKNVDNEYYHGIKKSNYHVLLSGKGSDIEQALVIQDLLNRLSSYSSGVEINTKIIKGFIYINDDDVSKAYKVDKNYSEYILNAIFNIEDYESYPVQIDGYYKVPHVWAKISFDNQYFELFPSLKERKIVVDGMVELPLFDENEYFGNENNNIYSGVEYYEKQILDYHQTDNKGFFDYGVHSFPITNATFWSIFRVPLTFETESEIADFDPYYWKLKVEESSTVLMRDINLYPLRVELENEFIVYRHTNDNLTLRTLKKISDLTYSRAKWKFIYQRYNVQSGIPEEIEDIYEVPVDGSQFNQQYSILITFYLNYKILNHKINKILKNPTSKDLLEYTALHAEMLDSIKNQKAMKISTNIYGEPLNVVTIAGEPLNDPVEDSKRLFGMAGKNIAFNWTYGRKTINASSTYKVYSAQSEYPMEEYFNRLMDGVGKAMGASVSSIENEIYEDIFDVHGISATKAMFVNHENVIIAEGVDNIISAVENSNLPTRTKEFILSPERTPHLEKIIFVDGPFQYYDFYGVAYIIHAGEKQGGYFISSETPPLDGGYLASSPNPLMNPYGFTLEETEEEYNEMMLELFPGINLENVDGSDQIEEDNNGDTSASYYTPSSEIRCYNSVNIYNGAMWHRFDDFVLNPNGRKLEFYRTYSAKSTYYGILGYGWTHNFNIKIENVDGGSPVFGKNIRFYGPGGNPSIFLFDSGNSRYLGPPASYMTLVFNSESIEIHMKSREKLVFNSAGKLISKVDPNGYEMSLTYTGDLLSRVDGAPGIYIDIFYDNQNRIIKIKVPSGSYTKFTYDSHGDLVSSTDLSGNKMTYTYKRSTAYPALEHNLISYKDAQGSGAEYTYYKNDKLYKKVDAIGKSNIYFYSPINHKTKVVNNRGEAWEYQYDIHGNAIRIAYPDGSVEYKTYDKKRNLIEIVNRANIKTTFTYDQYGNMKSKTTPKRTVTYQYNNNMISEIDYGYANGRFKEVFSYDTKWNLISHKKISQTQTIETKYEYNSQNLLTATVLPTGGRIEYEYDSKGNRTIKRMENRFTDEYYYDAFGRLETSKVHGITKNFIYDSSDRVIVSENATQKIQTEYDYDQAGNVVQKRIKDLLNPSAERIYRYLYNKLYNIVKKVDPEGNETSYNYIDYGCGCASGEQPATITDAEGNTTEFAYDFEGRVILKITPERKNTVYKYDGAGNLKYVMEPRELRDKYEYDSDGNVTKNSIQYTINDPEIMLKRYVYNDFGELTHEYLGSRSKQYQYDRFGRVIGITSNQWVHFLYKSYSKEESFTYSSLGNVINYSQNVDYMGSDVADISQIYSYDVYGRLNSEYSSINYNGITKNFSTSYQYFEYGNIHLRNHDNGVEKIYYNYQMINLPFGISAYHGDNYIHQDREYLGDFRQTQTKLLKYYFKSPGTSYWNRYNLLAKDYSYSQSGRIKRIENRWNPHYYAYQYDKVGNILQREEDGVITNYTYNKDYELILESRNSAELNFHRDESGNILSNGFVYGSSNWLLSAYYGQFGFHYDSGTNQLKEVKKNGLSYQKLAFDIDGRLIASWLDKGFLTINTLQFYDFKGRRVIKAVDTSSSIENVYFYHYNGDQKVIQSMDLNGSEFKTYFYYEPGIDNLLGFRTIRPDGKYRAYVVDRDHLGSIKRVMNYRGINVIYTNYDTFGNHQDYYYAEADSVDRELLPLFDVKYTGREWDSEVDAYYLRARHYSPLFRRFLTEDPIRWRSGEYNYYAYAANNPVNYRDPFGLTKCAQPNEFIKESPSLEVLQPGIKDKLDVIDKVFMNYINDEATATFTNKGTHSVNSLHYSGNAIDLRVWGMTPQQVEQATQDLRRKLGADYDVVNEGTHIHVEYQPK